MDEPMRDLVVELDTLIVGDPRGAVEQACQQGWKFADPVSFICSTERAYYLSDGGHSRLVFDDDGGVDLSGVSTARVKARWRDPDVVAAANRLRDHMRSLVEREIAASAGDAGPR